MSLQRAMATWTANDVTQLKAAIASGILTVSYAGPPSRTITYQSLPEMVKLLAQMEASVNNPPKFRRVQVKKGFRG